MNDAADVPSRPTSAEPELRTVPDEELRSILANHKKWAEAEDQTGLDHLRANLSLADLREQDAILRGACLYKGQLQQAKLGEAELQGANLYMAQLRKAQLQGADLGGARMQGADLYKAQLQRAKLREAKLQGAFLKKAHLRNADLTGADFEQLKVLGEKGFADLTDADFRDADLSNAQLSTVTGLRAEMLAGAVLTNAKLPEEVGRFDALKHVEETSRNATTVFFGLLAASLYSWLTIATTTDVALITGSATSPLPIINTNIALSGFYLAAPLILITLYCYFHLYLQRLWHGLASLPAVFPDGEELDDKAYPWLLNGLVRAHFKKLELAQRPLTRFENIISILLAWWVVPLTLLWFWVRFLPRHDWWVTTLHVVLIAGAAWFGVYSYRLAVRTLSGGARATEEEKRDDQPLRIRIWRTVRRYFTGGMKAAFAGWAIVVVLSAGAAIEPGNDLLTMLRYETYADLTDDDISTKPSGWTGREETTGVEIAQVKGADLEGRDLRNADARRAFLVRAKLAGADLRGAILWHADLRGANLLDPDLRLASRRDVGWLSYAGWLRARYKAGAYLLPQWLWGRYEEGADLRGAFLWYADLRGANLSDASLAVADLSGADLSGADLSGARDLTQAQLDKACGDDKTQLPEGLTISTCSQPK